MPNIILLLLAFNLMAQYNLSTAFAGGKQKCAE
jgi:hypothetical protein